MTDAEKKVDKVSKMDLYGILEVDATATEKVIVKAYRKKALKYHPDKNPNNPSAVEIFHQLSNALEILTDAPARAAYDKILKARNAAEERNSELDAKRRKLKEDLERKEKRVETGADKLIRKSAEEELQAEITRLRREGNKIVEQEQERLQEELKRGREPSTSNNSSSGPPRLKVAWSAKKDDPTNGGYDKDILQSIFHKYGDVSGVVVSTKRKGSAVVEFDDVNAAAMAQQYEIGLTNAPLTVSWLSGQPVAKTSDRGLFHERDYESVVMMKLRQAEERKKLIAQMQAEEGNTF